MASMLLPTMLGRSSDSMPSMRCTNSSSPMPSAAAKPEYSACCSLQQILQQPQAACGGHLVSNTVASQLQAQWRWHGWSASSRWSEGLWCT